jgi:hypothetical protein
MGYARPPAKDHRRRHAQHRHASSNEGFVVPGARCVFVGQDRHTASSLRASLSPTQDAVIKGLKAAASEAKLTAPLEVSTVRPTDHGPGHFFACLKGTMPPSPSPKAADDSAREPSIFYQPPPSSSEPRVVYYSVFFDNDAYMGTRQPVIVEVCEAQQFTPVDLSPPPAPPKSPPKRR